MKMFKVLMLIYIAFSACKKSEFLSAKPLDSLVVPQTISDFQAFLDNDAVMNGNGGGGVIPSLGQVGSDDYYSLESFLNTFPATVVNMYTWNDDIGRPLDWTNAYRAVLYANIALDGISKIPPKVEEQPAYNNVKGSALFYRSHMFYQLAQIFSPTYSDQPLPGLGIPLRTTPDINEIVYRASVHETYDKILKDLKEAADLLPELPLFKTRPSKAAAFGLLARIYLVIQDYDSTIKYSTKCLEIQNQLIDYNDLNRLSSTPFNSPYNKLNNPEIIFQANLVSKTLTGVSVSRVDSVLYFSYALQDLRKYVFFSKRTPGYSFKGSYEGSNVLFGGIAVDEIYLTRAEAYARMSKRVEALQDLNALLLKRWEKDQFTPYSTESAEQALNWILVERRKELIFRAIRWTDLRRLNKLGSEISLVRKVNGVEFILPPNDKKFVFLIPMEVIGYNSNMPQNPR